MDTALIGLLGVLLGVGFTHYFNLKTQEQKLKYEEIHFLNNVKRQKLEEMFSLLEEVIKFSQTTPLNFIQMHLEKKIDFSEREYSFNKFLLFKNYSHMYFSDKKELIQGVKDFELQYKKALEVNGLIIENIKSNLKSNDFKDLNTKLLIEWGKAEKILEGVQGHLPAIYNNMIESRN